MKKGLKILFSLILAMIIVATFAFSSYAENLKIIEPTRNYSEQSASNGENYSVDVVWDDVSFSYSAGELTWNPENHIYEDDGSSKWTDDSGKVSVANYSDAAISVSIAFKVSTPQNGTATLNIEKPSFILDGANGKQISGKKEDFSSITANGIPSSDASLGSIVVSIGIINHDHIWSNGICTECGAICSHNLVDGACTICGYTMLYKREGDIIYFGEYPQSLKASSVTVSNTSDSRGYFLGSDNAYYARVTASPYESGYKFSTDDVVTNGTEYYFKVEPLKWRILSEKDGTALMACESIIDSGCFDADSNNYKESDIRAWLNNEFYKTAFTELEKALIQTVSVDNSLASTGYAVNSNVCENTSDNIYLLSYSDVTNSAYGFESTDARAKMASDYSIARGAWISTNRFTKGNGLWMLRTPNDTYSHFIRECDQLGEITDGGTNITGKFFGIVPAVTIKL